MTPVATGGRVARRRAAMAALTFLATTSLSQVSLATDFWELRLRPGALVGQDRTQSDLALGGGFDAWITSGLGALVGIDAGVVSDLDDQVSPRTLFVAPELGVWFGEDAAPTRWLLTARVLFGVHAFEHERHSLERLELGPEYGIQKDDGSLRFRAALLWAPSRGYADDSLELASVTLRFTFAWAPPAKLPPPPVDECLPCAPGCECPE